LVVAGVDDGEVVALREFPFQVGADDTFDVDV
jgi:hypothetical protein